MKPLDMGDSEGDCCRTLAFLGTARKLFSGSKYVDIKGKKEDKEWKGWKGWKEWKGPDQVESGGTNDCVT
jgi:hypothetical protein